MACSKSKKCDNYYPKHGHCGTDPLDGKFQCFRMTRTFKHFLECSKTSPEMQRIVGECVTTAIEIVRRGQIVHPKSKHDAGELALSCLKTLMERESIILTNPEEITAEYMAGVLNEYGN